MVDRELGRRAADRLAMRISDLSAPRWSPLPHQIPPPPGWYGWLLLAGRGCVAPWTRIYDPETGTHTRIDELAAQGSPINVLGLGHEGAVSVPCAAPFLKGWDEWIRFTLEDGSDITVTAGHRFLTPDGWRAASELPCQSLLGCGVSRPPSSWEHAPSRSRGGAPRWTRIGEGSRGHCETYPRPDGLRLLLLAAGNDQALPPSLGDVRVRVQTPWHADDRVRLPGCTPVCQRCDRLSIAGCAHRHGMQPSVGECRDAPSAYGYIPRTLLAQKLSHGTSSSVLRVGGSGLRPAGSVSQPRFLPDADRSSRADCVLKHPQLVGDGREFAGSCRTRLPGPEEFPRTCTSEMRLLEAPSRGVPSAPRPFPSTASASGARRRIQRLGDSCLCPRDSAELRPVEVSRVGSWLDDTRWTRVVSRQVVGFGPYYDLQVPGVHSYLAEGVWNHNSGKTDTCARYVVEHVRGPACLPGDVPHWIGIIAPTLGDAATSCFSGPSGIRAHDPSARMVTRPGGLTILWPNGSEAKLFGANSEDDTERLRSGGNRCVREGTLVRTEYGEVPIEDVRVGDRVWTRNGLRRVLRTWDNGIRSVQRFAHDAGSVWLTPDHEVWTRGRGWQQARSVTTDDTLLSWDNTAMRLSTTESDGIPIPRTRTTGTAGEGCSTGGCGPRKSVPSLPGCRCTIRTTTSETTGSATLSCSLRESIGLSTVRSAGPTGTAKEGRRPTPSVSGRISPVTVAGPRSVVERTWGSGSDTAPTRAETLRHVRGKSGCAACAEHGSPRRFGAHPAPVRVSALRTTLRESNEARVYDLTVEHDHEFFANGLLVSNCLSWLEELAAWRYQDNTWDQMRFGLRAGPHPHWVGSTTPKPRPLIKRLSEGRVRNTVVTRASTYDNPHLPLEIREALEETYGSTQKGRQELLGQMIDEDENALWRQATIDAARVDAGTLPDLGRISVGVDPSGGAGEQGIVVVGRSKLLLPPSAMPLEEGVVVPVSSKPQHHGYVLADRTCRKSPDGWGKQAIKAAIDWDADELFVEINYGGAMCVSTLASAAEAMGVSIPIRQVRATLGKKIRAEPVSALTSQGRWHHAGEFSELEGQMTTWHEDLGWSPDRLDASVWNGWGLKLAHLRPRGAGKMSSAEAMGQVIG